MIFGVCPSSPFPWAVIGPHTCARCPAAAISFSTCGCQVERPTVTVGKGMRSELNRLRFPAAVIRVAGVG